MTALLSEARRHFNAAPKADSASLDFIWRQNLNLLHEIIGLAETPAQAIQAANRFAFYDFTCTAPILDPAIRWYMAALQRLGVRSLPFDESELIGNDRCGKHGAHRVSTDMLYRLYTVATLARKGLEFHSAKAILEIGGGYGSLARTIMGLNHSPRYVIVDLPETLFFAELFLRHSFPDKPFAYADESGWPEEAEIVLVPTQLRRLLTGHQFDLAINTNSLGEMPREEAGGWLQWLVDDIRPAKLFSLNRFLNRVDEDHWRNRQHAAGMNFLWCKDWRILDWQVNPIYERCPYYMSIVTRNLHIIADLEPHIADEARMQATLDDIAHMDFRRKPTWQSFQLIEGNERPMMAKGWPDLTPDLTMTGPLYALWEARRHGVQVDHLLGDYLEMLSGGGEGFEEMRYIQP